MSFSCVYAQLERVQHEVFTKQDGIELDNINTIAFDNDGFLWLGGDLLDNRSIILSDKKLVLQRFNGKTFHSIPIPEALEIANVKQLLTRDDGKIYVNDGSQIVLFDPFTTKFQKLTGNFDAVSDIYNFGEAFYFVSQLDRDITLNKLAPDLTLEQLFNFTSNQLKFLIDTSTRFFPMDDYWLIGDDNFPIVAIKNDGSVLKTFDGSLFEKREGTSEGKIWIDEMLEKDGVYYTMLYDNETMHRVDFESIELLPLTSGNTTLSNSHIKIVTDANGNNVIASSKRNQFKLSTFEEKEGFVTLFHDESFSHSTAMTLLSKDLEKDLWMATSGNAELHYFKFPKKNISVFMPDEQFRGITKLESDRYLVASEGSGWYEFNPKENSLEYIKITSNGSEYKPNSSRNFLIDGDTIWSHSGSGLIQVNMKEKTANRFRLYPISCMVPASDSTIVYGTNRYNLMEFNIRTKKHVTLAVTDSLEIHDLEYRDEHGVIIGATNKGMLAYHLESKQTSFYNDPALLEDSFLLMADYHPEYGYLLGTRSGKIIAYNLEKAEFTTVYEDALEAGIATILFGEDTWWISTFNGLVAFNPKDKSTTRFSEKDGFSDNEGNRYSAYDTGDGLLFGTIAGLNFFKPENLQPEALKSTLELLKVRSYSVQKGKVIEVFDRSKLRDEKVIVLPTEFKELQVDFALTHNVQNREHHFRYRINNEEFIDIKEEQTIRFPILAAGNYRLEIEAMDFSSQIIGVPLILEIKSKNFFYKTWWFNVLVAVSIIALLLYFLKQSKLKRKLQEKFSQELILSQEGERNRIAKELHDSVGQQLTLIKQRAQNGKQEEITQMTHNALEEVRSISRGLYPAVLNQLGLTESIEQLVYDFDEQSETFFSTDIDPIDSCFSKEETLNYYRFIQESLTNVTKHAQAKAVLITIKRNPTMLSTTISDNGIGFDAKDKVKSKSLGIKTLAERIRILKGTLHIEARPNEGTSIIAEIPLK